MDSALAPMPGLSLDVAPHDKNALRLVELERFLADMRQAPAWRTRADMECDYYDSNQHSPEDLERYRERNLPVVTVNLIAPVMNLIFGMEAKTRTDWVVKADGSGTLTTRQADGLTAKLNEVERNSYADRACAEAYESQTKAGVGWVLTDRNSDPFRYPYRAQSVDRREIWWDLHARDALLRDGRWLMRKKWHDLDALLENTPGHMHQWIEGAMDSRAAWDESQYSAVFPYLQDDLIARDWLVNDLEWRNTDRRRACAYECWYRKPKSGWVLRWEDGRVCEFDQQNPMMVAALASGQVQPIWGNYFKMRLSWWVGPFRLLDVPSPYGIDFPYTPFWGYIEDGTRTPYGMIRSMKSLQDEVNARRARMMWQLGAVRTIAEEDAIKDHKANAAEIARPDAYVILRSNRKSRTSKPIEIMDHSGMNAQQFQVYSDAIARLQQAGGVYAPMLGDSSQGAEAGVAISQLIEQGTTALAKINDNFRFARTEVGRKLLALVIEDMNGKETKVAVDPRKALSRTKSVTFNQQKTVPGPDGNPIQVMHNDTSKLLYTVALGETPNNPTYQQQRLKDLVEFAKSMPDELKVIFADMIIEASDLRDKDVIAQRIRALVGQEPPVDEETATPEEMQEAIAAQQRAAAQQQRADEEREAQLNKIRAETADKLAAAQQKLSASELARAQTANTRMDTVADATKLNIVGVVPEGGGEGGKPGKDGQGGAAPAPKPVKASDGDIATAEEQAMTMEDNVPHPLAARVAMGGEMPSGAQSGFDVPE